MRFFRALLKLTVRADHQVGAFCGPGCFRCPIRDGK